MKVLAVKPRRDHAHGGLSAAPGLLASNRGRSARGQQLGHPWDSGACFCQDTLWIRRLFWAYVKVHCKCLLSLCMVNIYEFLVLSRGN